ncbi:glycosyltransferase family 4 protein [Pseudoalteromonas sp. SSM20]|uniref:glycosyltransferase family 4 protein n=1 Tax=Pseudoalteromonas sp. SSM20 TaxID=3139394 RepID=UPI003BAD184A
MKVLVIGYVWPEPKSSAAGSHILSIMHTFLSKGWQVEFASAAQKTQHMFDLENAGFTTSEITLNCDSFNDYILGLNPDIVMFDRFMIEEQFGWRVDTYCPNALKILDTEDLQSVRNARHAAHKANRELQSEDWASDLAKREIAAILRCDLSLIISDFELGLLIEHYKLDSNLLHHLPFMLDTRKLQQSPNYNERQHFVTIGNFRHAPNWDSVLYLQRLWPSIRKQLPKVELHIYGSYPPPKATALTNTKQGFIVKGWCDDAYDVIKNAKVLLSPLRFGAGIKGKFLDAMACETPSITTHIGIEGMFDENNWPGLVANTDELLIENAVSLYQDQALWQEKSDLCHLAIKAKFAMPSLASALIERVNAIKDNLAEHRLNNFVGAMLKHHSHASTKYMSQWITEKNKKR